MLSVSRIPYDNVFSLSFLNKQYALCAALLSKDEKDILYIEPYIFKDASKTCNFAWRVYFGQSPERTTVRHVAVGKVRIVSYGSTADGDMCVSFARHIARNGEHGTLSDMCDAWHKRHTAQILLP